MMPDVRESLQQTLSGSYTLERELTGGGMSRVFVARDTTLDRPVVVKVLSPELGAGVSGERFTRETKLAASLQQANIVPVLAAGTTTDGLPYYTMPFVEGESLRSHIATQGQLPIHDVVSILRDVAKALAYAHERGIVHRDIKPDNVLLSGGTAVVTDFGIAKALTAARSETEGATLTQLGTSIGTPAYMAPEQAAGDPEIDHRADIYSFGCMAYELIAGQSPFHGRKPQRLLAAQMAEAPRPVAELRPDTPAALAELVMKCLAKDAEARPQTAGEIIHVLNSVTSTGGLPTMPSILTAAPGTLSRALALYAGAFIVVAVLARAAIIAIGLPDWVFPGSLIVMALGLPVILFTAYVHRVNRRVATLTPTFTPGGTPSIPQGTMATLALKATPHISWHRTAMGGAFAVGSFVLAVGAFMGMRAFGIGPAGSLFAAGKLQRDEPLLVADFTAKGNLDSSLAGVVTEALRTDLTQSNSVRVVSGVRVRDALERMRRPPTTRVQGPLAREIAQRENIKAVIDGDVTPLGSGFIVTARVISAETGDELTSFRELADSPKELIAAVGKLGRSLRGKIGESLKSVQASGRLEAVSTASLDALKKYAEGSRAIDLERDFAKGSSLLKEAVAIDSTFAMAWRKLSVAYNNNGFADLGDSASARAFRFRDRLSEGERLAVTGYYYSGPGRDRAKAAQAYEAALSTGGAAGVANNLANIYRERQQFAKAESLYRQRFNQPDPALVIYTNLEYALVNQGKLAAAESIRAVKEARFPAVPGIRGTRPMYAYLRGQIDSAKSLLVSLSRDADATTRSNSLGLLAPLEQREGHLRAATRLRLAQRAVDSAKGLPTPAAIHVQVDSAGAELWYFQRPRDAVARLDAALAKGLLRKTPLNRRPYFQIASLYAVAGHADKARQVLAMYDNDQRDASVRRNQEPGQHVVRSDIALAEGKYDEAVAERRASQTLPDGPTGSCAMCDAVSLADVFYRAKMTDSAIVYYERYFTTPGMERPWVDAGELPEAHKRLGELYEQKADREHAAKNYRAFVDLWKTADAELQPQVAEVRRRLSRLADIERH